MKNMIPLRNDTRQTWDDAASFIRRFLFVMFFLPGPFFATVSDINAQPLPEVSPEEAGMDSNILSRVDDVIATSIEAEETPGAVLLVIRDGKIVWNKAYGDRDISGDKNPMTTETVFDLASMTKPVATATAVMQLVEKGKIRLTDPVSAYLPGFRDWQAPEGRGTSVIRVIHLLTHTSGLPAYPPVDDLVAAAGDRRLEIIHNWLDNIDREFAPGEAFNYGCTNYVTLQRIVEKITEMSLADYTREHIFEPLGMSQTSYTPPEDWAPVTAPTGMIDSGENLICTVHDPFARELMGGNSGNAGLFSTAGDLAVFAAMLMNRGEWNGTRILSKASVAAMTRPPRGLESYGRGLGWDLSSSYSTNQGDLLGPNAYGHTGFTGTSLVIDPDSDTAIILLANGVYTNQGGGSVVRLRSFIANVVAASVVE